MEEQMAVLEKEATMTLAERRAAARRKKILENMDSRMGMILGSTSSTESTSSLNQPTVTPKETTPLLTDMLPPSLGRILTSDCNYNSEHLIPKVDLPFKLDAQVPLLPNLMSDQRRRVDQKQGTSTTQTSLKLVKAIVFIGMAISGIYLEQSIFRSFLAVQGICLPTAWLLSRQASSQSDSEKISLGNNDNRRSWICHFHRSRVLSSNLFAEFILFVFISLTSFALLVTFRLI